MTAPAFRLRLQGGRIQMPGRPGDPAEYELIVEPGRKTVLMGRSGAGKSLLARLTLGQLPLWPVQTEGQVEIQHAGAKLSVDLGAFPPGASVPQLAALRGDVISFVPQGGRENLVPGWTVRQHFRTVLGDDPVRLERGYEGMTALGVPATEANLDALATELSEGMIRRVLVALSMARGAEVLVIDEPTTGLDPGSREAFRRLLDEQLKDSGAGLLLITHDVDLAEDLRGEALLVRDGVVVARTEDLNTAEEPFAAFVEASRVADGGGDAS